MSYVQGCAAGTIAISECSLVWQLAVIAGLLLAAIAALAVLRMRSAVVSQV